MKLVVLSIAAASSSPTLRQSPRASHRNLCRCVCVGVGGVKVAGTQLKSQPLTDRVYLSINSPPSRTSNCSERFLLR